MLGCQNGMPEYRLFTAFNISGAQTNLTRVDENLFELQKFQSNMRVFQTLGRKIQSEEFMDLLGAKNSENKNLSSEIDLDKIYELFKH